mgnify:CR=1 FL=1
MQGMAARMRQFLPKPGELLQYLCLSGRYRSSSVLKNLFQKELGDGGNREEGHTDYYTAITRIRSYLEKNMTYSSQTDVFSEDGDFTENFLTTSKIGHSVHFATAATLMFRYYGIPARYVEGYLITLKM